MKKFSKTISAVLAALMVGGTVFAAVSAGVDYLGSLNFVDREKIAAIGICGSGGAEGNICCS